MTMTDTAGPTTSVGAPLLFDGKEVKHTRLQVSGLSTSRECGEEVLRMDDAVRLVVEGVVTGVHHDVDKNGDLVRVQRIKVLEVEFTPWDPDDVNDHGIIRSAAKA